MQFTTVRSVSMDGSNYSKLDKLVLDKAYFKKCN